MDPEFLTTEHWSGISTMLRFLGAFWFFIIGFALTLLIAHAIVPSLVSTRQLPLSAARLRPMLYLGALGILSFALIFIVLTVVNGDVIKDMWERWWI